MGYQTADEPLIDSDHVATQAWTMPPAARIFAIRRFEVFDQLRPTAIGIDGVELSGDDRFTNQHGLTFWDNMATQAWTMPPASRDDIRE
jgi:hypothetical protein